MCFKCPPLFSLHSRINELNSDFISLRFSRINQFTCSFDVIPNQTSRKMSIGTLTFTNTLTKILENDTVRNVNLANLLIICQ